MREPKKVSVRGLTAKAAAASSVGALALVSMVAAAPDASAYSWEYPGGMNSTEFSWCLPPSRWNVCNQARNAVDEANSRTDTIYGGRFDNTKGNAFLHSYWHAR